MPALANPATEPHTAFPDNTLPHVAAVGRALVDTLGDFMLTVVTGGRSSSGPGRPSAVLKLHADVVALADRIHTLRTLATRLQVAESDCQRFLTSFKEAKDAADVCFLQCNRADPETADWEASVLQYWNAVETTAISGVDVKALRDAVDAMDELLVDDSEDEEWYQ